MMQPSDADIDVRLRAILQSSEFQPILSDRVRTWLVRWFDAVGTWAQGLGPATRGLVLVASLLTLAAIAIHVWRSYAEMAAPERRSGGSGKTRTATASVTPEMLLFRARSLADTGAIRDAARALQHAVLLRTCLDKNFPWQPALSDWEWLELLGPSDEIRQFTLRAQRLAFGPDPNRAGFDACADEVSAWIAARDPSASAPS